MKRILMFMTALLLVISLVACGGNDKGSSNKSISILTPYLSSVTTNEMVNSLESNAKANGWTSNVVDTKGDVGMMASRMEDVIAANTDAIIIVSTDPNQVKEQIQKAADKGIPVFGTDSGYIEGMTLNVTSDNVAMSKLITDYLFEQMGMKGNLVVLTHRPHPGILKRSEQLDAQLSENPEIQLVTEQHVDVPGPIENSRKQMESLLLANKEPGSISAVWTAWDEPAIGVAQAIEAAGRDDIIVTGIDGNSQAVEMIKNGGPLIATVKQNFEGMAEIVIQQMKLVFDEQTVESNEMYAPASLITKENAGE
jgi:ribose transport system substrate-binding protein